ncbi:NAD(P)-binding protein [Trichodelitschia bisporula]|uniref:NAD(P)-binding protein n=1 Tax=Trichodelitschia bisporula TaxID=703511 RepID=A0A6G1HPR3_9PEZI|nr:NAD(P)-binding protein [Trichodelitschia bisporula]
MTVKDKVILITGAASGMGLATATLLASHGARVSLADVQASALEKVASTISSSGGQVHSAVVDVRDRTAVESWISSTVSKWGKIDGCANLAGVIGKGINVDNIETIDDSDWDFVMDVNVKGLMNCMRAQIPQLKDGGSIVNAASVAGLIGFTKNAAYVASKHAVVGLTRSAAKELGHRGIRVNCFNPGAIDTPMLRASAAIRGGEMKLDHVALRREGKAEEIANLIEWLLSDGSTYITGTTQVIDGGWVC